MPRRQYLKKNSTKLRRSRSVFELSGHFHCKKNLSIQRESELFCLRYLYFNTYNTIGKMNRLTERYVYILRRRHQQRYNKQHKGEEGNIFVIFHMNGHIQGFTHKLNRKIKDKNKSKK